MSMERRGLIAIILSMGLWLAYDAFYLAPRVKEQKAQQEILAAQQAARADSIAAANPTPAASEAEPNPVRYEEQEEKLPEAATTEVQLSEPARTVTVVSDKYEIQLTSRGGEVVSARLPEYLTAGEPVEFFEQSEDRDDERVLSARLEGPNGTVLSLNRLNFEVFAGASPTPLLDGSRVQVSGQRQYTDVIFRATTPGGAGVERRYRFFPDRYDFEVSVAYSADEFPAAHQIDWGLGTGMVSTERNVKDDQMNFKASVLVGEEFHRHKPRDFGEGNAHSYSGTMNWTALQTKYFMTAFIPMAPSRSDVSITGDKLANRITAHITLPVAPGRGRVEQTVRVFMGPMDMNVIKALGVGLERNIEMGLRLIRPVSFAILWAMVHLYKVIPNYGWVILIISILAKVLFFRLTHKSFKSMKDMQDLAPRLQAVKEKYKDDKKRISEETMKVYKEAGVNPLGGCLPMLLQMPVFIALFNVLKYTIALRGAHWFGWISDLSQQEVLFTMPFKIPIIGDSFSLLPLLMGAAMYAQSKLGGSPTGSPGGSAMPAGMTTLMPIMMTFFFYKMPSGLVLYWLVNTILSAGQQIYINRGAQKTDEKPADTNNKKAPSQKRRLKSNER